MTSIIVSFSERVSEGKQDGDKCKLICTSMAYLSKIPYIERINNISVWVSNSEDTFWLEI